ncbi:MULTISPECIES: polyribonucleotide nucleotidyltransferase [Fusobacterium]|jgi:polyribonucleotide nucleotidyltransferase|uniref:Polyribonucleotide nucleotidyltransferase n=1 Tax=Fusobacterium mortiferum ATCC 9817 TaxID=469616 RepID=A0ABM6TXM9_FUSMR|nr:MULTISPECIES: polyribonucleotide nucleotidyltransferase [Fusobacterium]AVQ19006.1 polyribonucleotide nucleotidyltransferase [Fusobacterium mortiferum ATCC 9817]EEO35257.1 polyribonucleotide nucleotidyltransferase [Fusobacterium mortiferum ATCC 9817]MCF2626772.1 polyribonucleotide nucleotidyltransferase [Fusobacterium mortiferum]MCF2698143.1 polyribonucleotide nucleotidyltransferase [Fusobacterium mortiferum]MCI7666145.1 polyribonucleotide nucleotidyltransferase [Fusobacterium mortiferum]
MFDERKVQMELAGRTLTFSTGKIARQSCGAVMVQYGDTVLLSTVNRSKEPRKENDFFPLTVDYIEKFYAAGKFPGGFNKREGKPSTNATLTARLIDRPIRPMFPDGFNYDVHIVNTVFSFDEKNTPDYLGIIGSSMALMLSDLPFLGPVAGVVIGYKNGEFILNPTPEELETSELELSVAGTREAINMVEAGANELDEETMLKAIMFAHENIKKICDFQEAFAKEVGKEKMEFVKPEVMPLVKNFIDERGMERLQAAVLTLGKKNREEAVDSLEEELLETFKVENYGEGEEVEIPEDVLIEFKGYYHDLMKKLVRDAILYHKHRVDGRKTTEIRPLFAEVNCLPIPHGSAMFTRGETQAVVITTLGTKEDEQLVDDLEKEYYKKFYLHYNFPPYSVGETGRMGSPGRRELGHGSLAERALKYVIPSEEEFPYTIRVVSEITESNGSSSQASICGGSLSLMAAGVPIKEHVAGIAMGLIKEGDEFTVLTDIMGLEDHLGDMDFKVAGTKNGITALQMDIKITGITEEIMRIALKQALDARNEILELMNNTIPAPAPIKSNVPRIYQMNIPTDKIAVLIGPGGKNIKGIIDQTGATVDINDDGKVSIFCKDEAALNETVKLVNSFVKDVEVGEVYSGKVVSIQKFGAFMEILPGKEGLLHVSEISQERVEKVEDVLKVGDVFDVKVISTDNGKISLSKKRV